MKYDYLIVGAGLYGSVFAREKTNQGKKVLVIDSRDHVGGNCFSKLIENIHVCQYGGHIFHTNNKLVWDYVNQFAEFLPYFHTVRVSYKDRIYTYPINLMTLCQVFDARNAQEALQSFELEKRPKLDVDNLEDYYISVVGEKIYRIFIEGYTKKQWNKHPKNLPSFIVKRIPIRMTFQEGYYNDLYQGWPKNGYDDFFHRILDGIEVKLGVNFIEERASLSNICSSIIYTGKIDEFFNYKFGPLEYRGLRHENVITNGDFQGCATINYTDYDVPYTRIIEHKHFQPFKNVSNTVYTREYPKNYEYGDIPFYPINDVSNNNLYNQYNLIEVPNLHFCGRLGQYKYFDMDKTVDLALEKAKEI